MEPNPRSQSSQTSGASRRWRQSVAVTRRATKSACHAGSVPLRHVTRRHARGGKRVAERADTDGVAVGPALAPIARTRLRPIDAQRRRASKHRQVRRDPQGIREPQTMQRPPSMLLSPYSASATTAVSVIPAARVRRRSVRPGATSLETGPRPESGLAAARRIARPRLRQIQRGAHRPRPLAPPTAPP